MKYISKLIEPLSNKRGEILIGTLFKILIIVFVGMIVLYIAIVNLFAMEVKKTVKMEMNNLSSIIAADTYNASKHGSLQEYEDRLYYSEAYKGYLLSETTDNIAENLNLTQSAGSFIRINEKGNADFTLSEFELEQENATDKIRYVIHFRMTFNTRFFGETIPYFTKKLTYETHHIKNY